MKNYQRIFEYFRVHFTTIQELFLPNCHLLLYVFRLGFLYFRLFGRAFRLGFGLWKYFVWSRSLIGIRLKGLRLFLKKAFARIYMVGSLFCICFCAICRLFIEVGFTVVDIWEKYLSLLRFWGFWPAWSASIRFPPLFFWCRLICMKSIAFFYYFNIYIFVYLSKKQKKVQWIIIKN